MKFWGVEVKSGETIKVQPGEEVLHLSQASLDEVSGKGKGNESVCLFVNIDGQRLVLGTLSSEKLPQQLFDLVFEKDFELSHNCKNGSVHFLGYLTPDLSTDDSDEDSEDSGSDYENAIEEAAKIVKAESKAKEEKSLKIVEPGTDEKPYGDDEDSSEQETSSESDSESEQDTD
ncbi:histone deacetylase HDT1-like [Cornus florida]|uniref:histone deacetylase HDT1-like n=1 Tax=Cornus florida TaxID=4283 RepID=UPI00289DDCCF|nr:histone deacetylase HDT1-like [Cornus florida]